MQADRKGVLKEGSSVCLIDFRQIFFKEPKKRTSAVQFTSHRIKTKLKQKIKTKNTSVFYSSNIKKHRQFI